MKESKATPTLQSNRRSFLKNGVVAAGVAAAGVGLLSKASALSRDEEGGSLSKGDAAILQLLLAAEIIEKDLWQQYNELGGVAASKDRKSTRLNSSHRSLSRMPSSA